MYDYHIHSDYTSDAPISLENICAAAKSKGLKEICFTQHLEPNRLGWTGYSIKLEQIPSYCEQARGIGKKYGVSTKAGLEIGYEEEREKELEKILAENEPDFVLGSVHCIGKPSVTDLKEWPQFYRAKTPKEAVRLYFEKLIKAIDFGVFDAMSHFDVIKKYSAFPYELYKEPARRAVEKLADTDMGLEINTAGWRHECKEQYPNEALLAYCSELGIKRLTIGSDAHHVDDVGYGWGRAATLAKKCGFDSICTFKKRKPSRVKL
jgi:histidinol-phosphatase (PHP family)